jgi:hypothetical protein
LAERLTLGEGRDEPVELAHGQKMNGRLANNWEKPRTPSHPRWLLNLAYMTLGEYPTKVDPRFMVSLDHFVRSDQYHNTLFQNPGQGNHLLTVKLVGTKTNRPAVGARIKVVSSGDHPLTLAYRHVPAAQLETDRGGKKA